MKYAKEHGDYVFARSQQTILFSGRGPWNNETLKSGAKIAAHLLEQVATNQPWAGISCLFGESLMPPSSYELFLKQTSIRKSKGMKSLAIVIMDSDIANTIETQLSKAYQSVGLDFAFLASVEQGIEWIIEQKIPIDAKHSQAFFDQHLFNIANNF